MPKGVKLVPKIFRDADYYTFNEGSGKDDFNFEFDRDEIYDHYSGGWNFKGAKNGSEWTGRPKDKPFFGQIQVSEGNRVDGPRKPRLATRSPFLRTTGRPRSQRGDRPPLRLPAFYR